MSRYCNQCDALVVAHFHRGDVIRIYVQHQYSVRACMGRIEQLDVAQWLAQTIALRPGRYTSDPTPAEQPAGRRTRRVQGNSDARTGDFINPRRDRTSSGGLRRK